MFVVSGFGEELCNVVPLHKIHMMVIVTQILSVIAVAILSIIVVVI